MHGTWDVDTLNPHTSFHCAGIAGQLLLPKENWLVLSRNWVNGSLQLSPCGSFQKVGAPTIDQSSRAVIMRTPAREHPQLCRNSNIIPTIILRSAAEAACFDSDGAWRRCYQVRERRS